MKALTKFLFTNTKVTKFSSLAVGTFCLFLFQNCENFGAFQAYDELSSMDPHKDSWKPVDGLEVQNGEWVKVEEQVEEKLRLTDRTYITSKLQQVAIYGDEGSVSNLAIKYKINSLVKVEVENFGGPCMYSNPESTQVSTSGFNNCLGTSFGFAGADVIPNVNIFRSALKQTICDYLASDKNAQANISANLDLVADIKKSSNIPYLVHQLFYLGQEPRKRTLASLEDLYKVASNNPDIDMANMNANGLKLLTLAVCHSNGWEAP